MAKYKWYETLSSQLQATDFATALAPVQSGIWLSGHGAPPSGSGMLPLDGTNDPWRWAPSLDNWIGPAYTVTITAGDPVPWAEPEAPVPWAELDVYFTLSTVLRLHDIQLGENCVINNPAQVGQPTPSQTYVASAIGSAVDQGFTFVMTGDVTVFLGQSESDYGGPTAVPDPTLDILDFIGDLPVVGPYTFTETTPVGEAGQFWFDLDTRDVYLRDDLTWNKISTLPAP